MLEMEASGSGMAVREGPASERTEEHLEESALWLPPPPRRWARTAGAIARSSVARMAVMVVIGTYGVE